MKTKIRRSKQLKKDRKLPRFIYGPLAAGSTASTMFLSQGNYYAALVSAVISSLITLTLIFVTLVARNKI